MGREIQHGTVSTAAFSADESGGKGPAGRPLPEAAPKRERSAALGGVLLVDDEEDIRRVAGRMLERQGYNAFTAANGPDAIGILAKHCDEIDCVVLDLSMPEMDGAEVYTELIKIRPDIPIILTSGFAESQVRTRFEHKAFASFLQKPFKFADLKEKLTEVLGT